jgi:hypothetical protein
MNSVSSAGDRVRPGRGVALAEGSVMLWVRDPGDEAMEFIRKALHGRLVLEPPAVAGA